MTDQAGAHTPKVSDVKNENPAQTTKAARGKGEVGLNSQGAVRANGVHAQQKTESVATKKATDLIANAPAMAEELERYKAIEAAKRPDFEAAHYLIETQKAELERLRADNAQLVEAAIKLLRVNDDGVDLARTGDTNSIFKAAKLFSDEIELFRAAIRAAILAAEGK